MKFTLVWSGKLPSSGNKSKPGEVMNIRCDLHKQMAYLWQTHSSLAVLKEYGYVVNPSSTSSYFDQSATPRQIAERAGPGHMISLCEWQLVAGKNNIRYMPLVRKSLDLNCEIRILFLRQEDPGALIKQGGDLDGRIKTLLDALRMPTAQEQDGTPPSIDSLYCLMENDSLVSALEIETERLLFPPSSHEHEAHLVIEVSLRVLRVHSGNYCLL